MTVERIPLSESFFRNRSDVSIYDVIFPVVSLSADGSESKLIGTCFALGSHGLYATAAHLFEEFGEINQELRKSGKIEEFHEADHEDLIDHDRMRCGIVHFHRDQWLGISPVDRLSMCIAHDVAILFSANDYRGKNKPGLSIIETPAKDDEVLVLGYPDSHNSMNVVGGENSELAFDIALAGSSGRITEEFSYRRDGFLAFYPCFSVSAFMSHGQSGGPCLNMKNMGVIGINSRSMDGKDAYSVVSWLGKALDVPVTFKDFEFRNDAGGVVRMDSLTLRQLAGFGIISII
jgi:hypothetical protein